MSIEPRLKALIRLVFWEGGVVYYRKYLSHSGPILMVYSLQLWLSQLQGTWEFPVTIARPPVLSLF